MTEFEQQVADALKDMGVPDVDRVARRVAAAIAAAGDAGSFAEHTGLYGDKYRAEVQSAGLGALRRQE